MLPLRTLLKSVYFRVALLLVFVVALSAHPLRQWHKHSTQPADQHPDRTVLVDSPLFDDVKQFTHSLPSWRKREAVKAMCQAHYFPPWHNDRRVYDLVMISSELDWLEIRLHTLAPYVDYFVIVEAATTFTGLPKPLVLQENWDRFKEFHHKIIYQVIEDTLDFVAVSQWDHETFLRDSMLTYVFPTLIGTHKEAKKGDVIIVSDLDEIIRPETALILRHCEYPARLRLRSRFFYYAYQWQHRNGDWDHPQATTYGGSVGSTLAPEALRKDLVDNRSRWTWFRSQRPETEKARVLEAESAQLHDAGWHCSSCFQTIAQVEAKLNGFSHVEFNTPENRDPINIIDRYKHGLDLYGRPDFGFDKVPVADLPEYVWEQHNATGRFDYLLDRSSQYAAFLDAKEILGATP